MDETYEPDWLRKWFSSDTARDGAVIRKAIKDINRYEFGMSRVVEAARRRKWHVIENGGQVIVFCNDDGLTIRC